jgi:hypothetical protein
MPERKPRENLRSSRNLSSGRASRGPVGDAPNWRQKYFFRSLLILAGDFVVYYLPRLVNEEM